MEFNLRPWSMDDLDSLVHHANNFKIADFLIDRFPHPYRRADGVSFLSRVVTPTKNGVFSTLAISVNGEGIGSIGLHPQSDIMRKNMELGYWLAEAFWGKGIMTEAVRQMVRHGFNHWPDIDRIFARPFGSNLGSQRVLEKAGFTLEARFSKTIFKNGRFEDELFYAVRRPSGPAEF